MPTETAAVQLPVIKGKPFEPQVLPSAVEKMDFSMDGLEIEQLPAHGPADDEREETEVKPTESKTEDKQEKVEEKVEETDVPEETGEEVVEEPKPKSVLKAPVKKEEPKEDEEIEAKDDKPSVAAKVIAPPAKQKVVRDYSGYTEQEVKAFKQMSDEAYSLTTKLIKENKSLSQSSYLQHPDAYRLSPEYAQSVTTYQRASQEKTYWENQLERMENGEKLIPFSGWDPNTGQPVFGTEMEPTIALKNRVQQAILKCDNYAEGVKRSLQEYPNKYKSQINEGVNGIESFRQNTFAWAKDPSMEDHTLNIDGVGERSLKQIRQDVNTMLPSFLHGSPLVPLLQDLVISVRILQAEKAALESTSKVSSKLKEEADLVEPSGKGKPSTPSKKEKVHNMTEFRVDPSLGI